MTARALAAVALVVGVTWLVTTWSGGIALLAVGLLVVGWGEESRR